MTTKTIYAKLVDARKAFHKLPLKKSGFLRLGVPPEGVGEAAVDDGGVRLARVDGWSGCTRKVRRTAELEAVNKGLVAGQRTGVVHLVHDILHNVVDRPIEVVASAKPGRAVSGAL